MSAEQEPLLGQDNNNDTPMESAQAAPPEPSPRDRALEAFKKKLIDHREYDAKLKNRKCLRFEITLFLISAK